MCSPLLENKYILPKVGSIHIPYHLNVLIWIDLQKFCKIPDILNGVCVCVCVWKFTPKWSIKGRGSRRTSSLLNQLVGIFLKKILRKPKNMKMTLARSKCWVKADEFSKDYPYLHACINNNMDLITILQPTLCLWSIMFPHFLGLILSKCSLVKISAVLGVNSASLWKGEVTLNFERVKIHSGSGIITLFVTGHSGHSLGVTPSEFL